ncbi:RrF2 family transcriptional regulator [Pseudoroseicyclus aestuarii]|uniref:BadM/Rrf2 family transcriptional regulator n=1 Tax=Pseudoroseicyclus aestuarii TaxID=1795041 RepID=A0A318SUI3_9RHOB|nr:Rrf2 family transcriptional regulator [Pseudoroseicyclus aestuarii]PYE85025.1 BadM/Rrf2 family transcriptional regulator [Pseudoroseicyclus aestuarii]
MLSQKARYALHATIHLARKGGPATVAEIAEAEAIPRKFLEQILAQLKVQGLLTARRGPSGGYALARAAARISFADVLRAVEGPLALAPCASQTAPGRCADCESLETCAIRPILEAVRSTTALLLEGMSLGEAAGQPRTSFAR